MNRLRLVFVYLYWKLVYSIEFSTCLFLIGQVSSECRQDYKDYLSKKYPSLSIINRYGLKCIESFRGVSHFDYKKERRDCMFEFFILGRR